MSPASRARCTASDVPSDFWVYLTTEAGYSALRGFRTLAQARGLYPKPLTVLQPNTARQVLKSSLLEENSDPASAMGIQIKRVYDAPAPSDGYRVLIDRLWPRGVSKERARLDEWARELAPSTELRRWFGHDPSRFEEFRRRYTEELVTQEDKLRELRSRTRTGTVTVVYSARDTRHNDAVVIAEILRRPF